MGERESERARERESERARERESKRAREQESKRARDKEEGTENCHNFSSPGKVSFDLTRIFEKLQFSGKLKS